jgi:hypothetical protein
MLLISDVEISSLIFLLVLISSHKDGSAFSVIGGLLTCISTLSGIISSLSIKLKIFLKGLTIDLIVLGSSVLTV